jgi:hypothetical protein
MLSAWVVGHWLETAKDAGSNWATEARAAAARAALPVLPACTAEREIKYKSERKFWEEQQKEVAARLAALSAELEAHRGASRAPQLEQRIQVGGWVGRLAGWVRACRGGKYAQKMPLGRFGPPELAATNGGRSLDRLEPALLSRMPHACACLPCLPRLSCLQELEARLLQSERERDSARAQLHELTLSMRTEGEFGNAGKRLRWVCATGTAAAAATSRHCCCCSTACCFVMGCMQLCAPPAFPSCFPPEPTSPPFVSPLVPCLALPCALPWRSPYKGPLGVDASEGHEVQQMIDHLEQGSMGGWGVAG